MHFAYPLPGWALALVVAVVGLTAYWTYARLLVPIAPARRAALVLLRTLTVLLLGAFLLRPVVALPPTAARDLLVPILIDTSRSMRLVDVEGQRRIDRAVNLVRHELAPRLSREFRVDILGFGETLMPVDLSNIEADAAGSDLAGAVRAARERYRGQPVAGLVVLSDGGDTGTRSMLDAGEGGGPAVFTVGIGASRGVRDREVLSVTAGDTPLPDATVELNVAAVSHGFGTAPIELRVLANGRLIEVRRVAPGADGSPIHEVFLVSPERSGATVYTVEIPTDPAEIATENNRRRALARPPGRKRRILFVEGAPGFEHTFLARAWAADPGLEVDSVTRKGKNERGEDTFVVQAAAERTAALLAGYPTGRGQLFTYDGVVFGNVEGDVFSAAQAALTAQFVSDRGGGLLFLGARSFESRGLAGTALEEVLPLEISDRRGGLVRTSGLLDDRLQAVPNRLVVTDEGEVHPMMRLAPTREANRKRWAAVPALTATASLGDARPGASILAVAAGPAGLVRPLVAVQRYGQGRSMIFAGEASWRWKMLLPSADRTYETFWRQVARWIATGNPEQIDIIPPAGAMPGDRASVDVAVRDDAFTPVPDAAVAIRITMPGGASRDLTAALADADTGRYTAPVRLEDAGVYRVAADVRRAGRVLGSAEAWLLVGAADREMADPRLNEDALRRLAEANTGRYLRPDAVHELPGLLQPGRRDSRPVTRDLWHSGWFFAAIVLLLSGEWVLRRRWGLR